MITFLWLIKHGITWQDSFVTRQELFTYLVFQYLSHNIICMLATSTSTCANVWLVWVWRQNHILYHILNIARFDNCHYYMTDSRDRGIIQSAFENPDPYIPIRTDISSHYVPNAFIESKLNDLDLYYYSVQSLINGLLTRFARAILRNTGPWSFNTALASSGCTKTAVLYFSVWPSHPVNKPLIHSLWRYIIIIIIII